MVKKRKSSVQEEPGGEETLDPATEMHIPIPTGTGIIDFYYLFTGIGILMAVVMILSLFNII